MKGIILILCAVLSLGYSLNEDLDKKYCDKELPASKIAEFENCEQYVPKEILDNSFSCLKSMNVGTSYKDFRSTMCNDALRNKYLNCHKNKMKAQRAQTQVTTEVSEDKIEQFRQHELCMRKAMGIKDDA